MYACAVAVPPSPMTSKEGVMEWMETYRRLMAEQKKWSSFLQKMRLFPELSWNHGTCRHLVIMRMEHVVCVRTRVLL